MGPVEPRGPEPRASRSDLRPKENCVPLHASQGLHRGSLLHISRNFHLGSKESLVTWTDEYSESHPVEIRIRRLGRIRTRQRRSVTPNSADVMVVSVCEQPFSCGVERFQEWDVPSVS